MAEESEWEKESDSESRSSSEDESSIESEDSNPLNMELVAALDASNWGGQEVEGSTIGGGNRTSESVYKE